MQDLNQNKDLELENETEDEANFEDRNYNEEILSVIRSGLKKEEIAEKLNDYHDNDIASVLEFLSEEERKTLYQILGVESVSDIFSYLDDASLYIEELSNDKAADVIEGMDAFDAKEILDELDENKKYEIMKLIESDAKEDIELINSYDEDEFGSIMSTNFIAIKKDITIKEAMRTLIKEAADNDNISTIYVTEQNGAFYGAIDLKSLIIARTDTQLESLITTSYPFVYDNESISQTVDQLKEYFEDSIPVISNKTKEILGVITSQDLVDVVDDELGEDYAKLAGLTEEEDLNEPIFKSFKKRAPWLIVLLLLSLVVSSVIGNFESIIKDLSIIVCFQSLILDMAGNTGTQSLAVTIRVLMNGNLSFKERFSFIFKEIRIGFLNGISLAAVSFIITSLYIYFLKSQTLAFAFSVSACVSLSLVCAMVVASFTGTIIPIILKSLKFDPAVASGPLITTIDDFVAILIYYGLAVLLLINL